MTIEPVASTMMACETGMEAEQAYFQALGTVQQYSILNQKLTLTYNQGAGVLIYTSANLPFEHTLWTLSLMNGQPVTAESSITAVFTPTDTPDEGNVSGSSGCNQYNAGYTLDGNNITMQPAASTMMACETGMDTEQAYLQMLQASTSYQIAANILTLTGPSGSLTFTASRTPLTEALWKLVSMGDVNNPQPPVAGSNFAAQFSAITGSLSGILTGTTGCNEYSTAFAASLDQIKINPPFSTQNTSCAPGLSDQEQNYFLALNDATTYRISGNNLILPYDEGKQSLVFEGTQLESANRPPLQDLNGSTWYLWYINNTPLVPGTTDLRPVRDQRGRSLGHLQRLGRMQQLHCLLRPEHGRADVPERQTGLHEAGRDHEPGRQLHQYPVARLWVLADRQPADHQQRLGRAHLPEHNAAAER